MVPALPKHKELKENYAQYIELAKNQNKKMIRLRAKESETAEGDKRHFAKAWGQGCKGKKWREHCAQDIAPPTPNTLQRPYLWQKRSTSRETKHARE